VGHLEGEHGHQQGDHEGRRQPGPPCPDSSGVEVAAVQKGGLDLIGQQQLASRFELAFGYEEATSPTG
jgi:hypothetical protein